VDGQPNAIDMIFSIPAYPFWALVIIAADVVALWGLCAYGSRENLTSPNPATRRRLRLEPGGAAVQAAAHGARALTPGDQA
jgi:hypothetical protein